SGLGVVGLDLDRLFQRLRRNQLLDRGAAGLETLLGVLGGFDRDGLPALGEGGQALEAGIHEFLAELAGVFERLRHGTSFYRRWGMRRCCAMQLKYCAMHKKSIACDARVAETRPHRPATS